MVHIKIRRLISLLSSRYITVSIYDVIRIRKSFEPGQRIHKGIDPVGNSKQGRESLLTRSGSQSQRRLWWFLTFCEASHALK